MTEFVEPPTRGGAKFVGAVEQMYASQCFQKGTGASKMGCISCHDPHSVPIEGQKVAFYRDRCMNCHKDRGCSLPPAARPDNNCIACHVPPTGSDVKHTTISDHRIPRIAEAPKANPGPLNPRPVPGETTLVNFHANLLPAPGPDEDRALAIALVREADRWKPAGGSRTLVGRALPLLESAVTRDETDLTALEAKGNALWDLRRAEEAAADYEWVLRIAAERESTLFLAADLALQLGQLEKARLYAERAVKVNPWRWEHHRTLARVCAQANDWESAVRECNAVLKLHATEPGSRHLLIVSYLRQGKKADAKREFDVLMELNPPRPDELRRWFAEQMR
jgi:tetratricopeptide (TPR) repeat protein